MNTFKTLEGFTGYLQWEGSLQNAKGRFLQK